MSNDRNKTLTMEKFTKERIPLGDLPDPTSRALMIGIDPGLRGAIVAVDSERAKAVFVADTPVLRVVQRRLFDVPGMNNVLVYLIQNFGPKFHSRTGKKVSGYDSLHVILEQSQAMPGQGVTSMWTTGYGFGLWYGLLVANDLPRSLVRPMRWQKAVYAGVGMTKGANPKVRSILRAQQIFPRLQLVPDRCRVPSDGRADAALLAWYGVLAIRRGGDKV